MAVEPRAAPPWDGLPPLPAVGSVIIQIWAAEENDKWDIAKWDEALWAGPKWREVTAQIMNLQMTWGADDNQGALSTPAAGSWSLVTYDPQRLLDPANIESPFASFLRPGGLMRILYRASDNSIRSIRKGYIDEVEFDIASMQGKIRGSDGISLMVKAKLRE